MAARGVAAQRAIQKGPSLTIPTGTPTLRAVAARGGSVQNDHKGNPGGGRKGLAKGEGPRRGK